MMFAAKMFDDARRCSVEVSLRCVYGCATIGEFYEVYNELTNRHIDRTSGKQLRSSPSSQ